MTLVTAWLALPHPVEPLCSPYRCCSIAPCPEQGLLAVHEAAGGAKRTPRSPLLLEPGGGEKKEHFNKLLLALPARRVFALRAQQLLSHSL